MLGVCIRGVQENLIDFDILQCCIILHLGVVSHVSSVQVDLRVPLIAPKYPAPLIYLLFFSLVICIYCDGGPTCHRLS